MRFLAAAPVLSTLVALPGPPVPAAAETGPANVLELPTPDRAEAILRSFGPDALRAARPLEEAYPRLNALAEKAVAALGEPPGPDGKKGSIAPGRIRDEIGTGHSIMMPYTGGRLFIRLPDGKLGFCSAGVVKSRHRNVIATAGHCAYDPVTRRPFKEMLFVPYYLDNFAWARGTRWPGAIKRVLPFGFWIGHRLSVHKDFSERGDWGKDYAFLNVFEVDPATYRPTKRRIGDITGEQGMTWNRKDFVGFSFGYPMAAQPNGVRPFGGSAKWCYGASATVPQGIDLGCSMTAGASGGSWLHAYQNATRAGYINGVTSLYQVRNDRIARTVSPYFDGETYRTYLEAATSPPP